MKKTKWYGKNEKLKQDINDSQTRMRKAINEDHKTIKQLQSQIINKFLTITIVI